MGLVHFIRIRRLMAVAAHEKMGYTCTYTLCNYTLSSLSLSLSLSAACAKRSCELHIYTSKNSSKSLDGQFTFLIYINKVFDYYSLADIWVS